MLGLGVYLRIVAIPIGPEIISYVISWQLPLYTPSLQRSKQDRVTNELLHVHLNPDHSVSEANYTSSHIIYCSLKEIPKYKYNELYGRVHWNHHVLQLWIGS